MQKPRDLGSLRYGLRWSNSPGGGGGGVVVGGGSGAGGYKLITTAATSLCWEVIIRCTLLVMYPTDASSSSYDL